MGDNDALDLAATTFPILSLTKRAALVSRNADELPTCGKGGLRNGWFNSLLLVDSNGQGWVVNGARKLHGVGPFWGYNIFLNQRIKVDLLISDGPFRASVEDVRNRVLKSLRNWHGGATDGGVEELKQAVEGAASISEIISFLEKNQDQPLQEKS
jgi:hypothetical protein